MNTISRIIKEFSLDSELFPMYLDKIAVEDVNRCLDQYLKFAPNHEDYVPFHRLEDRCFGQNKMLLHLVKRLMNMGRGETLT